MLEGTMDINSPLEPDNVTAYNALNLNDAHDNIIIIEAETDDTEPVANCVQEASVAKDIQTASIDTSNSMEKAINSLGEAGDVNQPVVNTVQESSDNKVIQGPSGSSQRVDKSLQNMKEANPTAINTLQETLIPNSITTQETLTTKSDIKLIQDETRQPIVQDCIHEASNGNNIIQEASEDSKTAPNIIQASSNCNEEVLSTDLGLKGDHPVYVTEGSHASQLEVNGLKDTNKSSPVCRPNDPNQQLEKKLFVTKPRQYSKEPIENWWKKHIKLVEEMNNNRNHRALNRTFALTKDWSQPFPSNRHNSSKQTQLNGNSPQKLRYNNFHSNPQPYTQNPTTKAQNTDMMTKEPVRDPPQNRTHAAEKRKLPEPQSDQPPAKIPKSEDQTKSQKIAIAPVDYPATLLNKHQLRLVKSSILAEIDKPIRKDFSPRFVNCCKNEGTLVITCFDDATCEWLKKITETLMPWPTAKLIAVDPGELHRVTEFRVLIPDSYDKPSKLLHRLNQQNKGLNTSRWSIKKCTKYSSTQTLILGLKNDGVRMLEMLNFEAFLNFGKVTFVKIGTNEEAA